MISIGQLTDSLTKAAASAGFSVEEYGSTTIAPLVAFRRVVPDRAPRVYLSSGVHGDEPAGPNAILQLLTSDLLRRDIDLTICPLINPIGLSNGTRENGSGVDLNRDFLEPKEPEIQALTRYLDRQEAFDLSICLHEDWEAAGFYTYYIGPSVAETIAREIVSAVGARVPIETATLIDGREANEGLILPPEALDPFSQPDWPEAFYLFKASRHSHFTTETPSALPLEDRIDAQTIAVRAALARIQEIAAPREPRE